MDIAFWEPGNINVTHIARIHSLEVRHYTLLKLSAPLPQTIQIKSSFSKMMATLVFSANESNIKRGIQE
jgi:hypothetical protein